MRFQTPSISSSASISHSRAFMLLIALFLAPGSASAQHSVTYSNGIDPAIVVFDGDASDLNPIPKEIEIHFTLEDGEFDNWIATGVILATTTDPSGATLVVTDTTIQNITGEQVLGAQIVVEHDFPPVVTLTTDYVAHIDGSFDKIGGGELDTFTLNFSAQMTGKFLGQMGFQQNMGTAPQLFDWTGTPVHQDTIIHQRQHFIFYIDGLDNTINFFDSATISPTVGGVPAMDSAARLVLVVVMGTIGIAIWRLRFVHA